MGVGKKQDLLPQWELEHWIPYNTQDISKVHCKLWKWQQQLSYLHRSRCRTSLMCSLYRWSQLWKVLACSYFLIPESRSFAALAKEGICTGMNLNINGKHKQFYIMEKHSVLKQMDFTAWTIAFHCLVLAKSKFLYDTKTIVGCWQAVILQEKSKWATTMLGILFSPENNALRSAWGQTSQNVMFYPRETLSMKNFMFPTGKSEKKPIKFWRESIMSLLFQLQVAALSHFSTLLPFQFNAWFWKTWSPFFSLFPLLRWKSMFQNIPKSACSLVLVYSHFILQTRGCLISLHLPRTGEPRWVSL